MVYIELKNEGVTFPTRKKEIRLNRRVSRVMHNKKHRILKNQKQASSYKP